ncbi:MAG: hypothetical protein QXI16_05175 [Sulfolobaceae archaeon]
MKKKLRKVLNYYRYIPNLIRHLIILIFAVLCVMFPLLIPILFLGVLLLVLYAYMKNKQFINQASGNGIIYGGRGKGKGLLLNYRIYKDKTKPFCNVQYGNSELLTEPAEYLNSIEPLKVDDFINGTIKHIPKIEKYEKRNIYLDDVNVYMPNWVDAMLKKKYDSMPPMLAINRHLYDAFMIITTQDRERPYKLLKELQSDFSIKAIKTYGWGHLWNCLPVLNYFVYTKYIYHELPKAVDMLPFQAMGVTNELMKTGYLTSGQATKEVYEATNGVIKYGFVLQRKKIINYDTRYFHQVVYGRKAPK